MKIIFTLLLVLTTLMVSIAQLPELVKNINPVTFDQFSNSNPREGILFNGHLYFSAEDYQGRELWRTDGTPAGTTIVRDLFSIFEQDNADPQLMRVVGNDLFFWVRDGQFYKLNNVTGKFTFIAKLENIPSEMVIMDGNLYFPGENDPDKGVELLRFDVANNVLDCVTDIFPAADSSMPHNLLVHGDTLFFAANNATNGNELWLFNSNDGLGYYQVSDIKSGSASSDPSGFVIYHNELYFTADDGTNGAELWKTTGEQDNASLVKDINGAGGSNPGLKVIYNDKIIFNAFNGIYGLEIWTSDGTDPGTNLLRDINAGSPGSNTGKYGYKQSGSLLYFAANDGTNGIELWKTNGTEGGTLPVHNISPFNGNAEPQNMVDLNGTLIFSATIGGPDNFELWKTTGSGASMILDIQSVNITDTPRVFGIYNNRAYFNATSDPPGIELGNELWSTDGINVSLVKNINYGQQVDANPRGFEPFSGMYYFGAYLTRDFGKSLFKSDGTMLGTVEVKPAGGVENFSVFGDLKKAGSFLYFAAFSNLAGGELWKSDGTLLGTQLVKDINPGNGWSIPFEFIELGTQVFFLADDGTNGRELWKSDGIASGTILVKDILPGGNSSNIRDMLVMNSKLYFVADDGMNGEELWMSDGTNAGTVMVKNINPGVASSSPSSLKVIGNFLYFGADDGSAGREMWRSDGTDIGTVLFKDINPSGSSDAADFTQFGSWIYFGAKNSNNDPTKLWRTDGTALNTSQFFDVNFPFFLTNTGSRIVFITLPAGTSNGFHIWSTDGTPQGTIEIEDFLPGGLNYILLDKFPVYNNRWILWLDDGISGQELWQTDGTIAGTIKHDIAPGPSSSYARAAKSAAHPLPLLFGAFDATNNGDELWKITLPMNSLPVTGLTFNVNKKQSTAVLEWKTFTEINNKGFQVQRSKNGLQFESIGFVKANAIDGSGANYSFTDVNPLAGKNFYRLNQTDIDNKSQYSQVRWVDFSKGSNVNAYPNPTNDVLHINTGYKFNKAQLSIRSMSGQLIKQQQVSGNGTITIPVKDIQAGLYSAEITEGNIYVKFIFVKQ